MGVSKQSPLLLRMANKPPALEGGVSLEVEAEDNRHAKLRLALDDHRLELRAAVLASPYPSGLRALLAAEPDVEVVIVEH